MVHAWQKQRLREEKYESCEREWAIIGDRRCDNFDILNFLHVGMKTGNRYRQGGLGNDESILSECAGVCVRIQFASDFIVVC